MKEFPERRQPQPCDFKAAEAKANDWKSLPTRKRNALARDEMFHREYPALAIALIRPNPERK